MRNDNKVFNSIKKSETFAFKKDKSDEKKSETEENLLEHRTDGTDAFDTLFIGCEKFPISDYSGAYVGGVD